MATKKLSTISLEFVRQEHSSLNKFDQKMRMLGYLYATQSEREIGKLHTYYAGFRTELDYTKYGVFLFPNEGWNEPIFYFTGIGIDHTATVIKGHTITTAPAARDAVRLYRNCVLPKSIWLPESLRHYAHHWDVFGYEVIVAMDNAPDLIANGVMLMILLSGAVPLRMPPGRGDLKGTVERTQETLEDSFISHLPGYVARTYAGLDPRYKKIRDRAKAKANMTVAQYDAKYVESILEFNHKAHPRLKKSRIQVWRDGQELAPLVLPTGRLQIRTTFALTYNPTLTREGVEVDSLKFNSDQLHHHYLTYTGKVIVKLNPDDVRAVLVFLPHVNEPIEAFLTTFDIDFPVTLELLKLVLARWAERHGGSDAWQEDIGSAFLDELHLLQSGPHTPTPGKTTRSDAQAAMHAAAAPTAKPAREPTSKPSLESLLKNSKI
jgi:hypothetical protein